MDTQTNVNLPTRPQMTLRNMNSGNAFYMPLTSFAEMWYQIFLWALFSSIFVHTIAGAICFATLRQHKYGKYILSAAYHNNGRTVAADVGRRQLGGGRLRVQSVRLSNAALVRIVLGYRADRGTGVRRIHANLSDFVTCRYKNYTCDIYVYI